MKKVLFCAAMVAAMSMAFVACGKKDNKNAEGEEAALVLDNEEGEEAEPAAPCAQPKNEQCDFCPEKFVEEYEAACANKNYTKVEEMSKVLEEKADKFSTDQLNRIAAAALALAGEAL